ncbi:Protein C53H9.3 [Aphelenchoides avenae]|nr:Protein C53H9.3 [Aphelenchus avenae]
MLLKRATAFKPFGLVEMAVRHNCPWHRSNWREFYFPFNARKELNDTERILNTPGGRLQLMRRVLREEHFLTWNHPCKPKQKKLSNPL